jgi:hypothetical protein
MAIETIGEAFGASCLVRVRCAWTERRHGIGAFSLLWTRLGKQICLLKKGEAMPMTRAFYVAVPYSVAELTEPEEGHEIGGYIDHEGYDCRGYGGDVFADGEWHSVWGFGSEAEAVRL